MNYKSKKKYMYVFVKACPDGCAITAEKEAFKSLFKGVLSSCCGMEFKAESGLTYKARAHKNGLTITLRWPISVEAAVLVGFSNEKLEAENLAHQMPHCIGAMCEMRSDEGGLTVERYI